MARNDGKTNHLMRCTLTRVYGIVQGVGFRPFVARIASGEGIKGSVCNKGPFVEIYAAGSSAQVDAFLRRLSSEAPERSAILKVETEDIDVLPSAVSSDVAGSAFRIIESEKVAGDVFVSPDIATCDKCRAELFDKDNRRYLHPFINCTACGPRLTILDSMPYDRVRTSMKDFPMCGECEEEYTTPSTRRYHAQPVCCAKCGPRLIVIHPAEMTELPNKEAIIKVRSIVRAGGIAAVKGIGGFHLCCDAANEEVVLRLRGLKSRRTKPFAVMMRGMDVVHRECVVTSCKQEAALTGHNKPIVLLNKRIGGTLCKSIAPDNPRVGVMLPYAPVQMLLFDYPDGKDFPDALVMTSGNPRGAPICRTDEDALEVLRPMCDIILSNNRAIRLRADDSVMAWDAASDAPVMMRRSRGYAPLPVMLSTSGKQHSCLAIGGELKNTFCLSRGQLYYLSPYIGDMGDVRSVDALRVAIVRMERLLEIDTEVVVCDKHPMYNTAAVAQELAVERGLPLVKVQHHHAHAASCMAENGWTADRGAVIAVAFDGTGYGDDGTVWGGEILVADYRTSIRAASVEPFVQAGGDLSSMQGWRIAASILGVEAAAKAGVATSGELQSVQFMIRNKVNTVLSTSMGRIFDAVSAILGLCRCSSFEGEAAMRVQSEAEKVADDGKAGRKYELTGGAEIGGSIPVMPTTALVREIARRKIAGEDAAMLARYFHNAIADMVLSACVYCRANSAQYGKGALDTVVLTGGVFNNTLLRHLCRERLTAAGFNVLVHTLVPAGDGGIALGQAAIASCAQTAA